MAGSARRGLNGSVPGTSGGVTDHGLLSGLSDNDHPQYRLVADSIDHGGLGGLADNDHPQYRLAATQIATADIADANVTLAKIVNVTASRLLGRGASGAGAPQELTLGTNLSISGTTLNAAGGSAAVADWFGTMQARAASRMSAAAGTYAVVLQDDFIDWSRWTKIGPGVVSDAAVRGGAASFTAVTGAHNVWLMGSTGGAVSLTTNAKWHCAARVKVATPANCVAATYAWVGVGIGSGTGVFAGVVNGAGGLTTKFGCARYSGGYTRALSTVDIDTNWHDLEIWYDGTALYFSFDNEAAVAGPSNPNVTGFPYLEFGGSVTTIGFGVDKGIWSAVLS